MLSIVLFFFSIAYPVGQFKVLAGVRRGSLLAWEVPFLMNVADRIGESYPLRCLRPRRSDEWCRPTRGRCVLHPVGTRGGAEWMKGPCACPAGMMSGLGSVRPTSLPDTLWMVGGLSRATARVPALHPPNPRPYYHHGGMAGGHSKGGSGVAGQWGPLRSPWRAPRRFWLMEKMCRGERGRRRIAGRKILTIISVSMTHLARCIE
jgi:hypothetical protein